MLSPPNGDVGYSDFRISAHLKLKRAKTSRIQVRLSRI